MVGRLILVVLCLVAGDPDRRSAGSLQPDGARPQPGDDLHRPLRPARPDRGQPGDAARGAAPHRALRQRLPVQLRPVQHRAGQPAGERAAAVAGRRLHLRVRPVARCVPAHDAELRPDPGGSRRDDWRRAGVDGVRAAAFHVRLGRGHRPPAGARGLHARQRATARRARGRGHDEQRDQGGRQPVHRVRHAWRHRPLRPVAGGADCRDRSQDRLLRAHPAARHHQRAHALLPSVGRQRRCRSPVHRGRQRQRAGRPDGADEGHARSGAAAARSPWAWTCGCPPATR